MRFLLAFQHLINDFLESLDRLRADEWLAIDKECGCAAHAGLFAFIYIGLDAIERLIVLQAWLKLGHVQPEFGGKAQQFVFGKRALVFSGLPAEQEIMILPELALVGGAFGGLCRPDGFLPQEGCMFVLERDLASVHVLLE